MPALNLNPAPRYAPVRGNANDGWSDNYGAFHVAAAHAGLTLSDVFSVRAIWQHGAMGPWEQIDPLNVLMTATLAGRFPAYVARTDEADYLKAAGFSNSRAIGLPFAYVPPSGLPRQPGTLLVVPTHTLIGATFSDRAPFKRYVEAVAAHSRHFSRIAACIHPNCVKNGLWVDEFRAHGVEIIEGAAVNDRLALHRIRALFDQFEFVTTNDWGSHIPYALACGARVSVFGPRVGTAEDDDRNARLDDAWRRHPEICRALNAGVAASRRAAALDAFRHSPHEGVADPVWGERFIGVEHRLSAEEMRKLLPSMVDAEFGVADPRIPAPVRQPRILFVIHESSLTGAPINLLHFLRWLRVRTTANFDVLVGKPGPLDPEFVRLAPVFRGPDIATEPFRSRGHDLIYANTLCCGDLVRALQPRSARVVTHIHELDTCYDSIGAHGVARVLRQSHSFIACSEFVRERAVAITGLPPASFSVHPEMADGTEARSRAGTPEEDCRSVLIRIPADALVIGMCGTASLRKGVDLFIQLAAVLFRRWLGPRPLRFLWIGDRKLDWLGVPLEHDLRRLLPPDTFIWAGEHPNCLPLLARLSVLCLTSREDPYPLTMLEAAALGRPVVAFRQAGGGEDFCDRGGGTAVPFLDVHAFADAVLTYLNDDALRQATGAAAARLVEERHAVEVLAPALWSHLQGVLAQPAPPINYRSRHHAWLTAPSRTESPLPGLLAPVVDLLAQADALLAAGRTPAAVPVVIKAAQTALAYRDLPSLLASLGMVADVLDRIDGKQARMIREQAETIARNNSVALSTYLV